MRAIRVEYEGEVGKLNVRPLTAAAITGVMRPFLPDINMVNANLIAKDKGITIEEVKREAPEHGNFDSLVRIVVSADDMARHAAGTVFNDGKPRMVEIRSINMEAEFAPHMIFVRNEDRAGFIGRFGMVLGEAGVNVATFNLGRDQRGGDAICLVAVDEAVSETLLRDIEAIPQVKRARRVSF